MANLPIDLSGKKMVDRAALRETVNPGMLPSLKFGPEERRALPRASAGEAQELPCDEIAGVRKARSPPLLFRRAREAGNYGWQVPDPDASAPSPRCHSRGACRARESFR